ncbi:unnamed protein product [Protopolystoma xenopodis]|uniref:Uncharacterized protein n=1 Tax=Protopolystoma xenopodis TaxID=117903 RepID=A0A448XS70_9PLAT|nr:unnamed protein product [Protopolystoma xenopodis]
MSCGGGRSLQLANLESAEPAGSWGHEKLFSVSATRRLWTADLATDRPAAGGPELLGNFPPRCTINWSPLFLSLSLSLPQIQTTTHTRTVSLWPRHHQETRSRLELGATGIPTCFIASGAGQKTAGLLAMTCKHCIIAKGANLLCLLESSKRVTRTMQKTSAIFELGHDSTTDIARLGRTSGIRQANQGLMLK